MANDTKHSPPPTVVARSTLLSGAEALAVSAAAAPAAAIVFAYLIDRIGLAFPPLLLLAVFLGAPAALFTAIRTRIEWRRDDDDALSRAANWLSRTPPAGEPLSALSCGLVEAPRDPAQMERERKISAIFDRVERVCRRLFRGQTALTEPFGSGWLRHYTDLDARLELVGERLILNRYRAGVLLDLGRLSDWDESRTQTCPRSS